jgi:hypothetical protein
MNPASFCEQRGRLRRLGRWRGRREPLSIDRSDTELSGGNPMPPTRYDQLDPETECCMYDAFTKATGMAGDALGIDVNAAKVDADDTQALLVLSKKYGFNKTPRGCTGERFQNIIANVEERTQFIVLVCTGQGNSKIPSKSGEGAAYTYNFADGFDATRMLTDKPFDDIMWHAIYVEAGKGGRVVVHDPQRKRPGGPVRDDRLIWVAREKK